ncbi:TolC family protein [Deferribacterales bacterium Es71-Z0220]|uniref:TolC family protein n=1 Tax=Deferrivibrio essentukiensis TaxID=2880922 RepID=UPI001F603330|nr:TolC family protein [Deferrivibrio essentukiensis]MCB4204393.1 TolC family protein [Deferrivibrio essentukiensis]
MKKIIIGLLSVFLISCVSFKPNIDIQKPNNNSSLLETNWWQSFSDDTLNNIIENAVKNNFDIQSGIKRLEQANITYRQSSTSKYPNLNLTAGTTLTKSDNQKTGQSSTDSYSLGLTLSYEIDLFNKIKSAEKSAEYSFLTSKENLKTILVSVTSQIAENYYGIISTNEKIKITEEQLIANEAILKVLIERYKNSSISITDVLKQKQNIENIKDSLSSLQLSKQLYKNKLKILTGGKEIGKIDIENTIMLESFNFDKINFEIALNRPDVLSKYYEIEAAAWNVSVAKANRFPSLTLSSSFTYSSTEINTLFENWSLNLLANLLAPIFDAGKRKLEVEKSKKILEEKVINYKNTLITAYNEISNTVITEKKYFESLEYLNNEISLIDEVLKKQRIKYLNGETDFSIYLNDQISLYAKRKELVDLKYNIIKNRITFYKSIGGKWIDTSLNDILSGVKNGK